MALGHQDRGISSWYLWRRWTASTFSSCVWAWFSFFMDYAAVKGYKSHQNNYAWPCSKYLHCHWTTYFGGRDRIISFCFILYDQVYASLDDFAENLVIWDFRILRSCHVMNRNSVTICERREYISWPRDSAIWAGCQWQRVTTFCLITTEFRIPDTRRDNKDCKLISRFNLMTSRFLQFTINQLRYVKHPQLRERMRYSLSPIVKSTLSLVYACN